MPVVSSVALALGNGAMATHFAWSAALLAYDSKLSITVICACATLATASAAANANASPVQRAGLDDGLQDRAPLSSRGGQAQTACARTAGSGLRANKSNWRAARRPPERSHS